MSQRASMSSTWSTSKVTKPRSHIGVCASEISSNLFVSATAPGTIDTINLTTSVRRAISHQIKIENPLQNQVNFNSECKLNGISVPSSFTIPSNGEVNVSFDQQASDRLICNNLIVNELPENPNPAADN